ncbi:hypothetical protein EUX98_g9320, partial [Antrodiella citrinella]
MRFSTFSAFALSLIPVALSVATIQEESLFSRCQSPQVTEEHFIGKDNNVKVQALHCANDLIREREETLAKRQIDVCGAECDTNCFPGGTGGPNPNDCHVIADAILFDSQNVGALFNITAANPIVTMTFSSCESFWLNQAGVDLQYCRTDWSTVLDFVADNCQSTQNAHGGNCVAADQRSLISRPSTRAAVEGLVA